MPQPDPALVEFHTNRPDHTGPAAGCPKCADTDRRQREAAARLRASRRRTSARIRRLTR